MKTKILNYINFLLMRTTLVLPCFDEINEYYTLIERLTGWDYVKYPNSTIPSEWQLDARANRIDYSPPPIDALFSRGDFLLTGRYYGWLHDLLYPYSNYEFFVFLLFIFMCFLLTSLLAIVVVFASPKINSDERGTIYECGFEPFGGAQSSEYPVQYFVIGILYLIFDLELAYLFPWVLCLGTVYLFHWFIMSVFLSFLVLGFVYEWRMGALHWV